MNLHRNSLWYILFLPSVKIKKNKFKMNVYYELRILFEGISASTFMAKKARILFLILIWDGYLQLIKKKRKQAKITKLQHRIITYPVIICIRRVHNSKT